MNKDKHSSERAGKDASRKSDAAQSLHKDQTELGEEQLKTVTGGAGRLYTDDESPKE